MIEKERRLLVKIGFLLKKRAKYYDENLFIISKFVELTKEINKAKKEIREINNG